MMIFGFDDGERRHPSPAKFLNCLPKPLGHFIRRGLDPLEAKPEILIHNQDEQRAPSWGLVPGRAGVVGYSHRPDDPAGGLREKPGLWGDGPADAGALRHRLPKGRNPSLGPPDRTCALACLHPPAQKTANLWFFGPTYYGVDVGWASKWREMQRLPALASQGLRYGSLPATPPS